eukprot:356682-Chlamydomonas_euryale.AAC.2
MIRWVILLISHCKDCKVLKRGTDRPAVSGSRTVAHASDSLTMAWTLSIWMMARPGGGKGRA